MARSNTYFSFKQFTIHQEQCAMKVGTDGVLLGAWADVAEAEQIVSVQSPELVEGDVRLRQAADVGTTY